MRLYEAGTLSREQATDLANLAARTKGDDQKAIDDYNAALLEIEANCKPAGREGWWPDDQNDPDGFGGGPGFGLLTS